jgi:precorrin-2/cobalt-factor-2 C20-methyltransferase
MAGKLYGVGVGPGDPELMTVKAWRLVSTARVIAYLAANGGESTARSIAQPFFPDDAEQLVINVPMKVEREPAQAAYDDGARQIAQHLDRGQDVVMLCEGDPFFYGSFAYIFQRLGSRYETTVVPGVTSVSAAAAEMKIPLSARDDVIKILPATLEAERLREELATSQTAAIIKVGRHFTKVKTVLSALDLDSSSTVIERATHVDQNIRRLNDIVESDIPYFSTVLVKAEVAP